MIRPALSHRQLVAAAKAVAHPARLRILAMLQQGPLCVCQMSTILELAPSTVSGHLNDLRSSGLVVETKAGKLVYYGLEPESPFASWLKSALALVREDGQVRQDAALIGKVRSVPIPLLTGGTLSLDDIRRRRARHVIGASVRRHGGPRFDERPAVTGARMFPRR